MNNLWDKKLIIRSDSTENRKYVEEDGETGIPKEITERQFIGKYRKYVIENCIRQTEGRLLGIQQEQYPERTEIQWTRKEIQIQQIHEEV